MYKQLLAVLLFIISQSAGAQIPKKDGLGVISSKNFKTLNKKIEGKFSKEMALRVTWGGLDNNANAQFPYRKGWKCPDCEQEIFDAGDTTAVFPDLEHGNYTNAIDQIAFTGGDSAQYVMVGFSSVGALENPADTLSTGVLGMAIYKQKTANWELTAFNPALGAFGAFGQANMPNLIWVGNHKALFSLESENINKNGANIKYGRTGVFANIDEEIVPVLYLKNTSRSLESLGYWESNLVAQTLQVGQTLPDLYFQMTGRFDAQEMSLNELEFMPRKIYDLARSKKFFNFVINRNYSYKNGAYEMTSEDIIFN